MVKLPSSFTWCWHAGSSFRSAARRPFLAVDLDYAKTADRHRGHVRLMTQNPIDFLLTDLLHIKFPPHQSLYNAVSCALQIEHDVAIGIG